VGATFIITLREAFEAALLLGIVYGYLDRVGARVQFRWVTTGGLLGLGASLALGVGVSFASGPLLDLGPDLVAAAVMLVAVVLLTWHAWWMREHARSITGHVEEQLDAARTTQRFWIVGLIAFVGVFREGAETVLFLWGVMAEASSASGWATFGAGVAGVATAALLGWSIFSTGRRVSLAKFFGVTTVVILFLAAGLLSSALGRLVALGFLPTTPTLWDTSAILDDGGVIGSFLSGLVGYRARPTLLEVAAYVGYLAAVVFFLFGRRAHRPALVTGVAAGRPVARG
jgi:high-affinity iron transporter